MDNESGNETGINVNSDNSSKSDFLKAAQARLQILKTTANHFPTEAAIWNENIGRLSPEKLYNLISSEEFGNKVAEAIFKTEYPDDRKKLGQEFGFVVMEDLNDSTQKIGNLIAGNEKSINLNFSNVPDGSIVIPSIYFHTHPHALQAYLLKEVMNKDLRVPDFFSEGDLTNFHARSQRNQSLIYSIGIQNRDDENGTVLMISSNNFKSNQTFNPKEVVDACWRHKETNSTPPLDVFRRYGLNAVALNVDLHANEKFDPTEAEAASRILTTQTRA